MNGQSYYKRIKGFTLAELLIVVAIIGVLVAVSIPIFASQKKKAEEATCAANRRSLMAAVRAAEISDSTASDKEWVAEAAKSFGSGVTADGYTVKGLCPNGGTYTVTLYVDDTANIACDKHTASNKTYSDILGSSILSKAGEISRTIKDGNTIRPQTLNEYLNNGKFIDSESPETAQDTQTSWTYIIYQKMNLRTDQMWMIKKDGEGYALYMTTDGKPTSVTDKDGSVKVTKHVYDSSGQLLTDKTETTKVKVEYHNGTDYLVLKP